MFFLRDARGILGKWIKGLNRAMALLCLLLPFLVAGCGWFNIRMSSTTTSSQSQGTPSDPILDWISISTPAVGSFVTSPGLSTFVVEGSCSEEGAAISLTIEDSLAAEQGASLNCTAGLWQGSLDLSPMAEGPLDLRLSYASSAGVSRAQRTFFKDTVSPTALLTQAPAQFVTGTLVNATVTGSPDIASYQFKIEDLTGTGCQSPFGYSPPLPVTSPLLMETGLLLDGLVHLCLLGTDLAGNAQAYSAATDVTWTKNTGALSFASELLIIETPNRLVLESSTGSVQLFLSANPLVYDEMYLTNTAGCSSGGVWEAYSPNKANWLLDSSQKGGEARVYVKYRKGSVESACLSDGIDWRPIQKHCSDLTSTAEEGILADSGGEAGGYGNNENCVFTVTPAGGGPVTITSKDLQLSAYDIVLLIDGDSSSGKLLERIYDYNMNNLPESWTATSGTLTIEFKSTSSGTNSGYQFHWTTPAATNRALSGFKINNGALGTQARAVTLTMENPLLPQMTLDPSTDCSGAFLWETTTGTKPWTVSDGSGKKPVSVRFRDSYGHETGCESASIFYDASSPSNLVAQVSTQTVDEEINEDLVATVSGPQVVNYRYKFGDAASTDCRLGAGYSGQRSVHSSIDLPLSAIPSNAARLCVLGVSALGVEQDLNNATITNWDLSALPPKVQFTTLNLQKDEDDSSLITLTLQIFHPYTTPISVDYEVSGTAVSGVDHTLSSGSTVIPAGALTKTISFQALGNGVSNSDRTVNVAITKVSPGAQIWIRASHSVVLMDNDSGPRRSIIDASYGNTHGCFIDGGFNLYCWGENADGNLGDNSRLFRSAPVLVASGFKKVVAAESHTCAINTSDKLFCWGLNNYGQVGIGNTTSPQLTPQAVDASESYLTMGLGRDHTCAITTSKKLKCWGQNGLGQLGLGNTTNQTLPQAVDAANNYLLVGSGSWRFTCALRDITQQLYCWGENNDNALGLGWNVGNQSLPVLVDRFAKYKTMSLGPFGGCGITLDDDLRCWGVNYGGYHNSLFVESMDDSEFPTNVLPGVKVKSVDLGFELDSYETFACYVTLAGEMSCLGADVGDGVLGLGRLTYTNYSRLVRSYPIDPGATYQKALVGYSGACGWLVDGDIKCWGANEVVIHEPRQISTSRNFTKVSVYDSFCFLTSVGEVYCSGGDSNASINGTYLRPVDPGVTYKKIQVSNNIGCGLTTESRLRCWWPEAGIAPEAPEASGAVNVAPSLLVKEFSHNGATLCAITDSNALYCWGENRAGQLGNGTWVNTSLPQSVDAGVSYKKVAVGDTPMWASVCGLTLGGVVKCWGYNAMGTLGNGTLVDLNVPTPINGSDLYTDISVGYGQACAITLSGQLQCWGSDSYGQLGNGAGGASYVPIVIDGGVSYQRVGAGYYRTCGVLVNGTAKCWGSNGNGFSSSSSLGVGSTSVIVPSPAPVLGLTGIKDISVGYYKVCSATDQEKAYCWGDQDFYFNHPMAPSGVDPFLPNYLMGVTHP